MENKAHSKIQSEIHEIQKHILKKLSTAGQARYSELKPDKVESNHFVYHLKKLVGSGLIAYNKSDKNSYSLTAKGKHLTDRVSFAAFKERIQPKIVTILVLERTTVGKNTSSYLFYERDRAPFIGYVGFPYGKIHLEERLQEAAERELLEKTGLTATLTHRGDVYITVHDETELVSHMLCHIFYSKVKDKLIQKSDTESTISKQKTFWSTLDEIPKEKLIPGVSHIAKLLKEHGSTFFFDELFLNV